MEKILKKQPVIGFVRYSQKINFGPEKDVFEAEYFEYRFEIFKKVTLESFQQQNDQNFLLLVLHSENMPSHYKQRFHELEESNSFLHNIFVADNAESFNESLKTSYDYVSFEKDAAITFRIDNDDAVQNDFIQKLSAFVKKDFIGYTISVPAIMIVKRMSNQTFMVEERYYPSNSIGLAYVTNRKGYKTIMHESQHHLVNDTNPMIMFAKNAAVGLQTINGENAINSINFYNAKILSAAEFEKYIHKLNFAHLDLSCLRIFRAEKNKLKFGLEKVVKLLIPPIFFLLLQKLRCCKFSNFFFLYF